MSTFFGRPDFKRGRWGWAEVAQPNGGTDLYRRVTTVAGYLDDMSGLIDWKSAMTAFGMAKSPSLLANFRLLSWADDKAKVKEMVKKAASVGGADDAADMGTAFHKLVEMHHAGEDLDDDLITPEFKKALKAYTGAIDNWGFTCEATELTVVNDTWRAAGTADLVFSAKEDLETPFGTIPAGECFIADVKTGSVSELSGMKMGMQLGIYAHSTPYDAGKDQRTEWPKPISKIAGLIIKVDLKAGEIIPWWLDLQKAYELVELSLNVSAARTAGRKLIAQADLKSAPATTDEKPPAEPEKPATADDNPFTEESKADDTWPETKEEKDEPAEFSVEHAQQECAKAANVAELRELYKRFSRGGAGTDACKVIAEAAAALS